MKLSKLFHTLYATVMALPVLVIPIFALNILHKETEPISIEVEQEVFAESNYVETYEDLRVGNIYKWTDNIPQNSIAYAGQFSIDVNISLFLEQYPQYTANYSRIYLYQDTNTNFYYRLIPTEGNSEYQPINAQVSYFLIESISNAQNINSTICEHIIYTDKTYSLGYQYVTYNNTDIGSQFIYALYKPVHDYFNFGEFFGLGGMYDWFQLNIFNGTAPLSFFIVFNVMIYWLFISLFWLIFDILIYVPMVIHKWLDKAEM